MAAEGRTSSRRWTAGEDEALRRAIKKYENNSQSLSWQEIALAVPGRTNKDCRKRWVYNLAPSIAKGAWEEAEDSLLLEGIKKHGFKWSLVSQFVGSRQPDQCSRRWHECLNPNISNSRWTPAEDKLLGEAVQMHGRKWTEIVERYFPTRTPIAARNRHLRIWENQGGSESVDDPSEADASRCCLPLQSRSAMDYATQYHGSHVSRLDHSTVPQESLFDVDYFNTSQHTGIDFQPNAGSSMAAVQAQYNPFDSGQAFFNHEPSGFPPSSATSPSTTWSESWSAPITPVAMNFPGGYISPSSPYYNSS